MVGDNYNLKPSLRRVNYLKNNNSSTQRHLSNFQRGRTANEKLNLLMNCNKDKDKLNMKPTPFQNPTAYQLSLMNGLKNKFLSNALNIKENSNIEDKNQRNDKTKG